MHDLVLEIGAEHFPGPWLRQATEHLRAAVPDLLRQEGLPFRDVRVYGTPRRLAVCVTGVPPRQPDTVVEVRGPAARLAFDSEGNYTSAAFGFARTQDVFPEDLKVRRVAGGEYLFVERVRPGRPTTELAAQILPALITDLSFPRAHREDDSPEAPASVIRWLLALYGSDVVPLIVGGVASGRCTRGHRERGGEGDPCLVEVADASAYAETLRAAGVLVDPAERHRELHAQVCALASGIGAAVHDEVLLEEASLLVEKPTAFCGVFDPEFLSLPGDLLICVLRGQGCFALVDAEGRLLHRFVGVHDGGEEGVSRARAAAENRVSARLGAMREHFEQDHRAPLSQHAEALRDLVVHERLGTWWEKSRRLEALAAHVCDAWDVPEKERAVVHRAASLAKVDLASRVVQELPELRGVVGRELARQSGEPHTVCEAIALHYLPRLAGDPLPEGCVARVVGVADRADTLVGFLAAGLAPMGSQDPYHLRAGAAGLVALLIHAPPLSLGALVTQAYALYGNRGSGWRSLDVTRATLLDFLRLHLEAALTDMGAAYDTVDAVLDAGFDDIRGAVARARALDAVREDPTFVEVASAATRVANLIRFAARSDMSPVPGEVHLDLLVEEAEQSLYGAYLDVRPRLERAVEEGDYAAALRLLGELSTPIQQLLDSVLVMSDEEELRANRLRLLGEVQALFLLVADFTRLLIDTG